MGNDGWTLNFRDNKTISRDRALWLFVRTGEKALGRACRGMDICQSPELSPLLFSCALLPFTFSAHAFISPLRHTPGALSSSFLPSFLPSVLPSFLASACRTSRNNKVIVQGVPLNAYEKPAGGDRRLRLGKTNFALESVTTNFQTSVHFYQCRSIFNLGLTYSLYLFLIF